MYIEKNKYFFQIHQAVPTLVRVKEIPLDTRTFRHKHVVPYIHRLAKYYPSLLNAKVGEINTTLFRSQAKMKLILLLSCIILVQAAVIKEEDSCDGVVVNGVYHDGEVLKAELDRPYSLAVDRTTDTLYFSYSIQNEDNMSKSAKIDLKTKEFKTIDDVPNGFAQAIDQKSHEVYIGGCDGVYKYNPTSHKSEFIGVKGANIWNIFYKDVLYYSEFPSQFLYTFSDGQSTRFVDLQDTKVDGFIIDDDDEIFFTNATGFYGQKKGTDNATLYMELSDNGARGITTDMKGQVYVCFQEAIFVVNKKKQELDKVADMYDAFGLAFDNENNMIYADATKVVRLTPNRNSHCDTTKKNSV